MVPHLLSSRLLVVSASLVCLGVAAVGAPSAAVGHPLAGRDSTAPVTLAPGVTLRHVSMQSDGAPEKVTLLGVNLARSGVSVDAASPNTAVGAQRRTVRSQTNARAALAGVNADFFSLDNLSAAPRGMLVSSGRMLKSPTAPRNANLVLRRTKAGETASVGAVKFTGQVTRTRRNAATLARSLTTVNSLVSARAGGLVLLTSSMAASQLRRPCALATGTIVRGIWTVGSVRTNVYSTPTLRPSGWGLLSCTGNGRQWIQRALRHGDRVDVTDTLQGGTPWAAVSGGSVLVRNGRAYSDPVGERLPFGGRNAETFVCVAQSGRQLTIGTIDGYTDESAGVTYHELTQYMLSLTGCWSGLVLDGGGSTTMVAKLPGSSDATVQNVPADNPPRHVADTLVVFGKH